MHLRGSLSVQQLSDSIDCPFIPIDFVFPFAHSHGVDRRHTFLHVAIDRIDIGTKKQSLENEKTVVLKEEQLFQNEKTVVSKQKQLFEGKVNELRVSTITKKKIMLLHEQFGNDIIFSRADIMRITGVTSSPAGDLIKKMQSANLIEFVSGYGKGKYRFKENSAN